MDKNIRNAVHYKAGYAVVPLAACLFVTACSSLPKGELSLDMGIKDRGDATKSWFPLAFPTPVFFATTPHAVCAGPV